MISRRFMSVIDVTGQALQACGGETPSTRLGAVEGFRIKKTEVDLSGYHPLILSKFGLLKAPGIDDMLPVIIGRIRPDELSLEYAERQYGMDLDGMKAGTAAIFLAEPGDHLTNGWDRKRASLMVAGFIGERSAQIFAPTMLGFLAVEAGAAVAADFEEVDFASIDVPWVLVTRIAGRKVLAPEVEQILIGQALNLAWTAADLARGDPRQSVN